MHLVSKLLVSAVTDNMYINIGKVRSLYNNFVNKDSLKTCLVDTGVFTYSVKVVVTATNCLYVTASKGSGRYCKEVQLYSVWYSQMS